MYFARGIFRYLIGQILISKVADLLKELSKLAARFSRLNLESTFTPKLFGLPSYVLQAVSIASPHQKACLELDTLSPLSQHSLIKLAKGQGRRGEAKLG